ncbi:MAG: AI-2E family transporter [Patescibacteria group bacterium]
MKSSAAHLTTAKWFFIIAAVLVIYLFWQVVQPFALVLITAMVATIIFAPIDLRLQKLVKSPKLSALLVVSAVFVLIAVPLFIAAIMMINQASELTLSALGENGWITNFNPAGWPIFQMLPESVQVALLGINFDLVIQAGGWLINNVTKIFSSMALFVFNTLIFLVAFYYLLVDRHKFYKLVLELSPFKDEMDKMILKRGISTVRGVVFGALVVAIVQGIFSAIGLTIFGVPGALIWAGLVIIGTQIPLIGTALILGPAVLYLYFSGSPASAVGLLIWSVVTVGLVENVLAPIIVGNQTKMHSLLVLLSILGGIQAFGPVGFVVGPTILAGLMVVMDLYRAGILEKTGKVV